ncbi:MULTISPECIES: hypothetical protein [unclassified Bradyrhizobium]|uniref:hypothetical protein n=1 Tax=unclassified Bradyrhizobium TaxID=2631580 RepID=UPI001FFC2415|nr:MULTISPECIES: hypothetical protein [unclassified Bradyrhizobium]MCK1324695.1 hypothetical protein [Bradyrhizobium sp. 156]MCK1353286.1 hypothetical protein [Bradyrhizobium sp. CW7]UPJ94248.1 hypothetical protein IVB07_27615 [Bradyrhizobium sp. 172]
MDIHRYNQGNQRNRTDDADNSLRRYGGTEKPYFESLGMSQVGSPVFPDSVAERDVQALALP